MALPCCLNTQFQVEIWEVRFISVAEEFGAYAEQETRMDILVGTMALPESSLMMEITLQKRAGGHVGFAS